MNESLLATANGEVGSALASGKELALDPNGMLKSP